MRRLLFALALLALPYSAEAQRRGLNFETGLDKIVVVPVTTATSQTAARFFTYTPGFAFRIVSIKTYCRAKAGTVSGQVRIGSDTTTVLDSALVFTADSTEYTARVKARVVRVGHSSASSIRLYYTTDGSGALTNGFIVIRLRPI